MESLAGGDSSQYSEPSALAADSAAFLRKFDDTRRELRLLEQRNRKLVDGLSEFLGDQSGERPGEDPEALLSALRAHYKRSAAENRRLDAEARDALESTRRELESAREELDRTRATLEKERKKLDPVLRYAYNLRRLVQAIHSTGVVTPGIMASIEKLLIAGGLAVEPGKRKAS
ncbi:MAG: hypothetical protein ACPGJE_08780 [Wenzhouxiangellaceae bacterium]